MALVRGHDAHTGMRIEAQPTWGATADSAWETVPLLGEGLVTTPFFFPKSREFGNLGAATAVDTGRQFVSGEFTVYPRYNAPWFWRLIASCFSCEALIPNTSPDKTYDASADGNTHAFAPNSFQTTATGSVSGVSPGFTIDLWKSGDTTAGYKDRIEGAVVTGWTWNQPEDDRATVTFRIIGKAPVTTGGPVASLTAATSYKPVKVLDFSRAPAGALPNIFKVGNSLTDLNVRGFSITVDSGVGFAPAFMTAPDTLDVPGHSENWSITGEINALQETTYGADNKPWTEYNANTASKLRLRYISADNARTVPATATPYAIDMYCRNVTWTGAENNVASGGASATRFSFEAARGPLVFDQDDVAPEQETEDWKVPILVQCHVNDADDGTGATKFLLAANGGNELNSDIKS